MSTTDRLSYQVTFNLGTYKKYEQQRMDNAKQIKTTQEHIYRGYKLNHYISGLCK